MSKKWAYALLGLGFLGIASTARAEPRKRQPWRDDLGPVPEDTSQVDDVVCLCGAELAGFTGDVAAALLECVAVRLWPDVPWPPRRRDHRSVRRWWNFLALRVTLFVEDPEGFCEGPPKRTEKPPPVDFQEIPADSPGYPWEQPTIHLGHDDIHYPTPGTFYILDDPKAGLELPTNMATVAKAALGSALAMAGADMELRKDPQLRLEMKDLIVCSPLNDAVAGTTNASAAGGAVGMGPHGRGLAWHPRHRDIIGALAAGERPTRNVYLNAGKIGTGTRHLQIWIPAVNLDALRDGVLTTEGMTWSDGSSTIVPPPTVMAHGVDTAGVQPPGGGSWGC